MTQAFTRAFLNNIRDNIHLPSIIGRVVDLKASNGRWLGKCPFHDDRSPSFSVTEDRFRCFGCQKSGDVFEWIRQRDGVGFSQAVERAAEMANLGVRPQREPRIEMPLTFAERLDVCLTRLPLQGLIREMAADRLGAQLSQLVSFHFDPISDTELPFIKKLYRTESDDAALAIYEELCDRYQLPWF